MWVRTQIKIGWSDLLTGGWRAYFPPDRKTELRRAESFFADDGSWMASYSVRTGFELLLRALNLAPGDEVIFSAVNVRGMVKIVTDMGLVPVPVDIGFSDLSPSPKLLKAAITARSKVFIAAHLFGTRADLGQVFAMAKAKGLVTVEDCAQAFNGKSYPGHELADVTMFSFGPIKTATALGGALARIKDKALLARVRELQAAYPMQTDKMQLKRVVSAVGLKLISSPMLLGAIYRYYKKRGRNYEEELSNKVRDVAPLKQANGLHRQTSASLLWLMNRRMRQLSEAGLSKRAAKGERLAGLLKGAATLPGQQARHHDYWLFAVVTDKPNELAAELREHGFDAGGLPRSQTVQPPQGRADLGPVLAKDMLDHVVVVPCYESMPDKEIDRQALVIRAALQKSNPGETAGLQQRMDNRVPA